jgi:endonuclease YncB( thermonuclease family)
MAKIVPITRPGGRGNIKAGDVRATIWAGLLIGLLWVGFADRPASGTTTGTVTVRAAVRVVDGDTFWVGGDKIRIADIDTPETHPPRCAYEAELGERATRRLAALLDEGPFELAPIAGRDVDRYGRKLRIVVRDGRSLGDRLVSEGLARTWTGRREPWCA